MAFSVRGAIKGTVAVAVVAAAAAAVAVAVAVRSGPAVGYCSRRESLVLSFSHQLFFDPGCPFCRWVRVNYAYPSGKL